MKNVLDLVNEHYNEMFKWLTENYDTDMHELKIVVKLANDGTIVKRSWKSRDKMLVEDNK